MRRILSSRTRYLLTRGLYVDEWSDRAGVIAQSERESLAHSYLNRRAQHQRMQGAARQTGLPEGCLVSGRTRRPAARVGGETGRIERLSFYVRNAIVSLLRNRQRAVFAISSVAVGVAAIVGLLLTADVLEHKATTNVRDFLRGDVVTTQGAPPLGQGGGEGESFWATIQELQDEGLIDGFTRRTFMREDSESFLAHFKVVIQGRTDKDAVVNFYNPIFLETDVYPYYGHVRSEKPAGRDLADLMQDPYDVVVTSTVANRHDINVDDELKLGEVQDLFTVRGIISDAELSRECMPFVGCIIFRHDTMDSLFVAAPEREFGGEEQRNPPHQESREGNTILKVWPEDDVVWGAYGMDQGVELTLTIDDPATAEPVDYSALRVSGRAYWDQGVNYVTFALRGAFDLRSGHRISLSGPNTTATYTVTGLTVTEVNPDLDTVSGTADPSAFVDVAGHTEGVGDAHRSEFAGSTGEWTADFSVPGNDEHEIGTLDLMADTQIEVLQYDEAGHVTSVWLDSPQGAPGDAGQPEEDDRIILIEPPETHLYILAAGRSDADLETIDQRLESSGLGLGNATTAVEAAEDNKATVDVIRSVILVFGLVALGIGGLGIANTMQVLVRRRLPEAGVLKAIGLKGRQVMAIFLAEALIIGVAGSVAGILIGVLFSFATVRFLEDLIFTDLDWKLGAGPVITGLIVGIVVTLAFGLLPIVGAGRVRPLAAMRPDDSDLIKGSWLVSLLLLLGLALLAGIMVGVLIGSPVLGLIGTLVAFFVIGVLLAMLVGVVYLLSRLPTMRSLTLRLSFLEWRRHKTRAASTLLAMIIGVMGISLILLLSNNITNSLSSAYEKAIGADVFVLINDPEEEDDVFAMMREAEGVTGFSPTIVYDVVLVSHDGERFRDPSSEQAWNEGSDERDQPFLSEYQDLAVREVDDLLPRLDFSADGGRMLTADDVGKNTIVLQQGEDGSAVEMMGLSVGDKLGFVGVDETGLPASGEMEFEIVGFSAQGYIGDGTVLTATDPFDGRLGVRREAWGLVQVEDDKRDALVRDLNLGFDSVFAYETSFLTDFIKRLMDHVTMIPLLLSSLSLVAAVVIIANAVALSTMERRREIGLLKALGASSKWVVVQLALENTLLGFVGGAIGLALAIALLAMVIVGIGGEFSLIISPVIVIGVLALTVVLSLSVTLISAYPAAQERPLDVLRGE